MIKKSWLKIMGSSLYLPMLLLFCCLNLNTLTNSYSTMQPLCNEDESIALLQFKHSFIIDKLASGYPSAYPKAESWNLDGNTSDCCSWAGIVCDHNSGHVISLDLSSSFLYGSITSNSSLFNLVRLRRLNLADNHFNYSQIPNRIGSLSSLRSLNLSGSTFSGQIPFEISSLSKLAFLDLSRQAGKYSDNSLLKLEKPSLRDLVQNLTNLKVLNLGQVNMSSKMPSVLSNRSSLTHLNLRSCLLNGEFPTAIFHLPNLQILNVVGNEDLTGYLPEFHHISPLKILGVGMTGFSGTLPSTIGNLESLSVLVLNQCNFSGTIPASLGNLTKLSILSIASNEFVGRIPSWLGNLTELITFELYDNQLHGMIPSSISQLKDIEDLDLGQNKLQGSLPVPPPSTVHYDASSNLLAGEISPSICHNSSLSTLVLSYNNLSGTIPQCLANSSKALVVLDLRSNNFNGMIPETFTTGIKVIDLSKNQLHGQVPPSLANCAMLQTLVLANNEIEGTFPYWLGALHDLQVLILRFNKFHGAIENLETNLTFPKLRIIDLSHNGFSGNLPSHYFKNWNAMKMIKPRELTYMQVNQRSGDVDYEYRYTITIAQKGTLRLYERIQSALVAIDLSNNKFSGGIPESLGSLSGLQVLNVSNNNLDGVIPSSLASLTELESLDLSQNMLSGKIPQQLTQLTFLAVLDVSHNHLTGRIPQGKQFDTFENSSYDGNPELCGVPLSTSCENLGASPPPPPRNSPQGDETEFPRGIYWMVIFMGYGSGLIVGLVIGTTLTQRYHEWFVDTFERRKKIQKKQKRNGQRN